MRGGEPTRGPNGRTRVKEWRRRWEICDDLSLAKHQFFSESPGMLTLTRSRGVGPGTGERSVARPIITVSPVQTVPRVYRTRTDEDRIRCDMRSCIGVENTK